MEETMKIIKEAWNNHIYSIANETILGLETSVEGKDEFLAEVKEKITKLKASSDYLTMP